MDSFKVNCGDNKTCRLVVEILRSKGYRWSWDDGRYTAPDETIYIFVRDGLLTKSDESSYLSFSRTALPEKSVSELLGPLHNRWLQ